MDDLRDGAGPSLSRVLQGVQPGPDPVERAEYRVAQPPLLPVGRDDAVEHLLAAAVDPAHPADGPHDQGALVLQILLQQLQICSLRKLRKNILVPL